MTLSRARSHSVPSIFFLFLELFSNSICLHLSLYLLLSLDLSLDLYLPPEQAIDTVELYHLNRQRKLSLKFLASYLLNKNIQTETHDSIEDARTVRAAVLFLCVRACARMCGCGIEIDTDMM